MSWRDIFRDLIGGFPLEIRNGDIPFILTPQNSTGVNASGSPFVLAGSATGQVTFQLPGNAIIEIDYWNAFTSHTNWPTNFGMTVDIGYGNNQTKLTQQPVPAELIFGTGQRPGPWSLRPWVVTIPSDQAFGNLTISVTNDMTTTNSIWFALMGWNKGASRRGS